MEGITAKLNTPTLPRKITHLETGGKLSEAESANKIPV